MLCRYWRPHIYRIWHPRHNKFMWTFTKLETNSWKEWALAEAGELERKAAVWCFRQNMKEAMNRKEQENGN